MIPLPAELHTDTYKLHTDLGNYLLCKRLILHANMEIYCSFKSFAGGT